MNRSCPLPPTKDELRVLRSFRSIMAKIEVSILLQSKSRNHRYFEDEKELEDYCVKHGLIYSSTKYPF